MSEPILEFKNEEEEREFWATHDSGDYVDWNKSKRVLFPNLNNQTPTPIPPPARWAWLLSLATALVWIVLGVIYLFLAARTGESIPVLKWFIAALMFGNAAVLVWIGRGLRKQRKIFYYIALVYLAFNIVLTITDDFGIPDLIYLLFAGALFVALLLFRKKFK